MPHSKHLHLDTKIFDLDNRINLRKKIHFWHFINQRIVFTNGCFDILHAGHTDYLSRAADLGDVLVVGLNTDDSVNRLKGAGRPLFDQEARSKVLASLSFVDAVVLFEEDTPEDLIQLISPDVLVKGDDYEPKDIAGAAFVQENGGKVVTLPLLQGYSTSDLINKIQQQT
ncbi:MAG: D-glycero-beta-D-manno-heptose 1-phosphate adenylyltransferase [Bacteroidota bacterium]